MLLLPLPLLLLLLLLLVLLLLLLLLLLLMLLLLLLLRRSTDGSMAKHLTTALPRSLFPGLPHGLNVLGELFPNFARPITASLLRI